MYIRKGSEGDIIFTYKQVGSQLKINVKKLFCEFLVTLFKVRTIKLLKSPS